MHQKVIKICVTYIMSFFLGEYRRFSRFSIKWLEKAGKGDWLRVAIVVEGLDQGGSSFVW